MILSYSEHEFKKRLDDSHEAVLAVRERLLEKGIVSEGEPPSFRKNLSEVPHYSRHEKDLILEQSGICLEVKSRNVRWTCLDDFPFRDIIVDTVSGYDQKRQTPLAYVLVSRPTGAEIVVPTTMDRLWSSRRKKDKERNLRDLFYVALKSQVCEADRFHDVCREIEAARAAARPGLLRSFGFNADQTARVLALDARPA